ncbi:MAG: hypothetical protein GY705_00085 [Bacteroidetes bacterium]|nr:hypothetical protein [Bacteroidota bacterium]
MIRLHDIFLYVTTNVGIYLFGCKFPAIVFDELVKIIEKTMQAVSDNNEIECAIMRSYLFL